MNEYVVEIFIIGFILTCLFGWWSSKRDYQSKKEAEAIIIAYVLISGFWMLMNFIFG